MFREIRDHIINIVTSRLTVLMILFAFFAGVLLYRCFNLQIVNGEEYLNDFILQIEKTRDISSTRGRILDRNGNVLAENELAYSVKIEDVFESSRNKNAKVNDVVYRLIKLIEKNGDSVITDFKIIIDEDGDYAYSVDGTALLRFQADVLGYRTIDELSEEEKAMTAQELIEYLSRAKGFAIGQYEDPENTKTPFVPGKGYTKEEWLQMVTIRYAMNLTSFRKYVGTTVATNVSAETVAVIMENSDQLDGVSIVEDTVRHYIDSKYFAHVLGYTGKISSDELAELNDQVVTEGGLEDTYTINDGGVVNQTIPLILCAEEDGEGNHGATIGKLDDELLFYLESRSMNREQIYEMMAMAKVDAVCRKIPDAATRAKVQEFLGRAGEEEEAEE